MALYVVKENQELLWNVINNNAFVQQYFTKVGPEKKHEWFRNKIENFYEQNKHNQLTVSDLHNINRSTIAYMIENIRLQESENIPSYNDLNTSRFQANGIYTPPVIPDNRQQQYASQYDQRQKEYQQMVEKKPPAEINFSEKNDKDTAIPNMDKLMKQHIQERERELQIYKPESLSNNIQIDNSANIQIEVEEINTQNIDDDVKKNKKTVSWSNEVEKETNHIDYKEKYDELIEKYKVVENNLKNMTIFLTETSEKYTSIENKLTNLEKNYIEKEKYDEIVKKIIILETKHDNHSSKNKDMNNKIDSMEMNMNLFTKIIEKINDSKTLKPEIIGDNQDISEEKNSETSN
jgi:hypothetical protein